MDTGCASDPVSMKASKRFSGRKQNCQTHPFNTANDHSVSNERLALRVPPLDTTAEAIVLEQTPAVLSIGARQRAGFRFVWPPCHQPCWIRADGIMAALEVINDVPSSKEQWFLHGRYV